MSAIPKISRKNITIEGALLHYQALHSIIFKNKSKNRHLRGKITSMTPVYIQKYLFRASFCYVFHVCHLLLERCNNNNSRTLEYSSVCLIFYSLQNIMMRHSSVPYLLLGKCDNSLKTGGVRLSVPKLLSPINIIMCLSVPYL